MDIINKLKVMSRVTDLKDVANNFKMEFASFLDSILPEIGKTAQDMRTIKEKKEYSEERFLDQSGTECRHSKFA